MIQAFAIVFVKITRPYWDMTVGTHINYLNLSQYVQRLCTAVDH